MLSRLSRILVGMVVLTLPLAAQQRVFTDADYKQAEQFMGYNTNALVLHSGLRPTWLPDDRFWYRIATERGSEFILVDPVNGSKEPAFNQAGLAAALSKVSGDSYSAYDLLLGAQPPKEYEMRQPQ